MGYYKIKSHAGTGKLLNIAASGPISGRKNTNIWDESCPIDQTWSIASLGNNQQVKIINNLRWKQMRSTSIIISRRKDSPRMLSVGFLEI